MPTPNGPRALVTGAASGIGAATARLLHARGAHVVLADIALDRAQALAAELGDRAEARRLDVTVERDWEVLEGELTEAGPLQILVHSAGAASRSPIELTTLAEFRRMLDLNLVGTFLALRSASRLMAGGGAVVTLSSLRGVVATAGLGAYGSAKSGVRTLSRVAALELADRGIRVNTVCPGSIDTPITSGPGFQDDDMAAYVDSIPLRRRGTAEEVAHAIAYLVGQDAAYVTGTDLVIDGGMAAGRTTPRKSDPAARAGTGR